MPEDFELPELDDEGEESEQADKPESSVIKGFRERERASRKQLKAYEAEVAELRKVKEEFDAANLRATFTRLGLSEKHADLFRKANPGVEATEEAINAFTAEYGLTSIAAVEVREESPPAGGFAAPVPTVPPANTLSRDEWEQVYRENPAKAARLISEGRVIWHNLPNK